MNPDGRRQNTHEIEPMMVKLPKKGVEQNKNTQNTDNFIPMTTIRVQQSSSPGPIIADCSAQT